MGTPIRLVRNDGGIIELMATTLTMNVDRGVTPLPMPFAGGSRFAFDLNLPKALITIEGVMTDDDLLNIGELQQEASAVVDFYRVYTNDAEETSRFDGTGNMTRITTGVTIDDVTTATHAIRLNNITYVWIASHSTLTEGLSGGRYFITGFDGSSFRSASQLATSLNTLIATHGVTMGLSSTLINSPIDNTSNVAVEITHIGLGASGNGNHPSFDFWPSALYKPNHILFSGGRNSSAVNNKSAGDKVAELFAVLNNSNNGGGGALLSAGLVSGAGALVAGPLGAIATAGAMGLLHSTKYGDYIIAIQIPFSSKVNDRESLFYMPTGAFKEIKDKTADKALATGTQFKPYDSEYTGIKGSVANATFVQLGGEPLYSYTINFAPIDWIF
jgi:hypothetical protein